MAEDNVLTEILVRLARIEQSLGYHLTKTDDHESRLRALEKKIWLATGAAAATGGTLATIANQLIGG